MPIDADPRPRRSMLRNVDARLDRAERNLQGGKGAPRQVDLCRSASDAYYALFHYVADKVAREMLGTAEDAQRRVARNTVVRSLSHSGLRAAMRKFSSGPLTGKLFTEVQDQGISLPAVPEEARRLASTFELAIGSRYAADYDWNRKFDKAEVLELIHRVRTAIDDFEVVPANDLGRRWFLAYLATHRGLKAR